MTPDEVPGTDDPVWWEEFRAFVAARRARPDVPWQTQTVGQWQRHVVLLYRRTNASLAARLLESDLQAFLESRRPGAAPGLVKMDGPA